MTAPQLLYALAQAYKRWEDCEYMAAWIRENPAFYNRTPGRIGRSVPEGADCGNHGKAQ